MADVVYIQGYQANGVPLPILVDAQGRIIATNGQQAFDGGGRLLVADTRFTPDGSGRMPVADTRFVPDALGRVPVALPDTVVAPAEDLTLNALNDVATFAVPPGAQSIIADIRGTATMTVVPEGTIDGVNWFTLQGFTGLYGNTTSITAFPSQTRYSVSGYSGVRYRVSAFTSGSVVLFARFSSMQMPIGTMTLDTELPAAGALSDAISAPSVPLVGATLLDFNGSTYERYRHNESRVVLASAARTATPASTDQTVYGGIGIIVSIVTTAASGTGGLTVTLDGKDANGNYYGMLTSTPITAVGTVTLFWDPRVPTQANLVTQRPIPRIFRVRVTHGDASSYTYAVGVDIVS